MTILNNNNCIHDNRQYSFRQKEISKIIAYDILDYDNYYCQPELYTLVTRKIDARYSTLKGKRINGHFVGPKIGYFSYQV